MASAEVITNTYIGIRTFQASVPDKVDAFLRTLRGEVRQQIDLIIKKGFSASPEFGVDLPQMRLLPQLRNLVELYNEISLAREEMQIGRRDVVQTVLQMVINFTPANANELATNSPIAERAMVRRNVAEYILGQLPQGNLAL